MQIEITVSGVHLFLASPFNPDMAPRAKALGGRWDAGRKCWIFDARDEARVRDLCLKIYGTDGTTGGADVLTIRATPAICDLRGGGAGAELWLCGRLVARVMGRDSGARLGDGVVLVAGKFTSGGSMKNYRIVWSDPTCFEVRDVPRALAEKLHGEYHGVTLLDASGAVVAEQTVEPAVASIIEATAEMHERLDREEALARTETEIAAAEGRLAGLRFRAAELRAA